MKKGVIKALINAYFTSRTTPEERPPSNRPETKLMGRPAFAVFAKILSSP